MSNIWNKQTINKLFANTSNSINNNNSNGVENSQVTNNNNIPNTNNQNNNNQEQIEDFDYMDEVTENDYYELDDEQIYNKYLLKSICAMKKHKFTYVQIGDYFNLDANVIFDKYSKRNVLNSNDYDF